MGAKTDLSVLNPAIPTNREGLVLAAFLIVVAILGKVVTGLAVFSQEKLNRLAIGVGMIPRGEVGLVFAGVGAAQWRFIPRCRCGCYYDGDLDYLYRSAPVKVSI